MTDKIPLSRKAGAGLAKILRGLLGRKNLEKAGASVDALRKAYRQGREEAEEPPPRTVPHRVVEPDEPGSATPDP